MNSQRIEAGSEKFLHYMRELLVIGAMAALIVLVWKTLPVLSHAVELLDEVKAGITEAKATAKNAGTAAAAATTLIANTDKSLNGDQKFHGQGGLLSEAREAAKHVKAAGKQIAETSLAEKKHFETQAFKVDAILDGLKTDTGKLGDLLDGVNSDVKTLTGHATPALDELKGAIADADAMWKDPNIKRAILELANSGKNIDDVTASLAGIAQDVQGKVHTLTHPNKKQRALSGTLTALKMLYYVAVALK